MTIYSCRVYHPDDLDEVMKDNDLDEDGFDVIVETTGNPEAIEKALAEPSNR